MNLAFLERPGKPSREETPLVEVQRDVYSAKEFEQGTPNDVRMFPLNRRSASSQSIPIVHVERSLSEIELDEEEQKAEYRSYLMYQRISTRANNKTRGQYDQKPTPDKNSKTQQHFVMLKGVSCFESKDSLGNLIRLRHAHFVQDPRAHYFPMQGNQVVLPGHLRSSPSECPMVSDFQDACGQLAESEGIFEMDL